MAESQSSDKVDDAIELNGPQDVLKRMQEKDQYAKVNDGDLDKWIYYTYGGDMIYPVCVTEHSNGVADGEIIPNSLFTAFCSAGLTWHDEVPNDVKIEFVDIDHEVY